MSIFLGNLTIREIQERLGIKLSESEIKTFDDTYCRLAGIDGARKWHCFDIPFFLSAGSLEFAIELRDILSQYQQEMKEPIQIGVDDEWNRKERNKRF